MIYLINTTYYNKETKEVIDLLKIGFTDNWNKRKTQYQLHNPIFKTIHLIEDGTEEQESKLHYKFREKKYDGYGNEWYYYDEEIIKYIKSVTPEELDKLPNNPVKGDQRVLNGKRETRKILAYLFEAKDEVEDYLKGLSNVLGDSISFNTSLDYIKSDPNIDQDKLNHFLEIKKCKETKTYTEDVIVNEEVISFLDKYNKLVTRLDKLRLLCEYDMSDDARRVVLGQIPDNDDIKSFYTVLGPDRLHELGYNVTKIRKELGIVTFSPELLINSIYSKYHVGDRILFTDLKEQLKALYDSINYKETPKATNIFNYFDVKEFTTYSSDGSKKRVRGYELVSSHEQEMRDKLKAIKN